MTLIPIPSFLAAGPTPIPTPSGTQVIIVSQGVDLATWVTAGATILLAIVAGASLWTSRDLIRATVAQAKATVKLVDLTDKRAALELPNMEVDLVRGLCVYARQSTVFMPTGASGYVFAAATPYQPTAMPTAQVVWVRCKPSDEGAALFVQIDLQVRNRSSIDDGITSARLLLQQTEGSTISGYADRQHGEPFHGENVKGNSLSPLRLQFEFAADNYRQHPAWAYDAATKYEVNVATMRGPSVRLYVEPVGFTPAGDDGDIVSV